MRNPCWMSSSSTHVCMNIASLSTPSCVSVSSFSRCGLTCSAAEPLLPRTSGEGRPVTCPPRAGQSFLVNWPNAEGRESVSDIIVVLNRQAIWNIACLGLFGLCWGVLHCYFHMDKYPACLREYCNILFLCVFKEYFPGNTCCNTSTFILWLTCNRYAHRHKLLSIFLCY